jgi:hypothetical protein
MSRTYSLYDWVCGEYNIYWKGKHNTWKEIWRSQPVITCFHNHSIVSDVRGGRRDADVQSYFVGTVPQSLLILTTKRAAERREAVSGASHVISK